jgi:hypothetical protein
MTLGVRNVIFKTGIGFSVFALFLAGIFFLSPFAVPKIRELEQLSVRGILKPYPGFFDNRFSDFPYLSLMVILFSIVFSLLVLIIILKYFEMTQTPEILFFACFVFSFSGEVFRLVLPLKDLFYLPVTYVEAAERVLITMRFFGSFSFFAGSLYAAGLNTKKTGTLLFPVTIIAIFFAINASIDSRAWDGALNLAVGSISTFFLMELALAIFNIIDFLIASYIRANKHYIFISLGAVCLYIGRALLLYSDNLILCIAAAALLSLGTWIFCSRLHAIYLWL